jgi:phage terminase large subunit-like protein
MPEWSTACPDWESRIVEGRPLIPFDPLFPDEAAAAREVFGGLKIVDAPHSPTFTDVGRPWLFEFSDAIFGAYDPLAGRRLIREFFLLISKKNSKSTGAAAIMLTALIRNWRKSGEFAILAPTIEIANNSFFPARDMVREDPQLRDLCHVQEHYRTITNKETGAILKVVAADDETVGGKKSIGTLVDELWLFGKRPNAENMLREATGGQASRPEGFTIYLSTQSDDPPSGVFRKKLQYARAVRDGRIKNNRFLPVLYEFPKGMVDDNRCRDKGYWYITNPNLGASVDEEFLTDEYDQAVEGGPDSVCGFLAKHLNIEMGLSLRSDRWAGAEYWQACGKPKITLDYIIEYCELAVVGIDGGGLDDLLGLAVLGRHKRTRDWLLWTHAWAHTSVLERRKDISERLRDFEAAGDVTIVERVGDDVEQVADIVERLENEALLPPKVAIGVDQVGISAIVDELSARGIAPERIGGVPQGWKLNNAIKTMERKLAGRTVWHSGSDMMAWVVGNAKAEPKGNAVSITKQVSGSAKIDPLMATFDAVEAMRHNSEPLPEYQMMIFA